MTTETIIPTNFSNLSPAERSRLVAVAITVHPAVANFLYPPHNYSGALLLNHCLRAALLGSSLLADVTCKWVPMGPLNHSAYLFSITDRALAFRVLKEKLVELNFIHLARMGWMDPDEIIWRQVHPERETGVPFNELLSEQALRRATEEFCRLQRQALAHLQAQIDAALPPPSP